MARILYTNGTGNAQTTNQSETYKLPIYDSEQDVIDDLANLEVGDLVATDDPSESETIATLITKVQELEEKIEADDVYSTEEVKTNKKWWNGTTYKSVYHIDFEWSSGNVPVDGTLLVSNVERIFSCGGMFRGSDSNFIPFPMDDTDNRRSVRLYQNNLYLYRNSGMGEGYIWIEYTKTTN